MRSIRMGSVVGSSCSYIGFASAARICFKYPITARTSPSEISASEKDGMAPSPVRICVFSRNSGSGLSFSAGPSRLHRLDDNGCSSPCKRIGHVRRAGR